MIENAVSVTILFCMVSPCDSKGMLCAHVMRAYACCLHLGNALQPGHVLADLNPLWHLEVAQPVPKGSVALYI